MHVIVAKYKRGTALTRMKRKVATSTYVYSTHSCSVKYGRFWATRMREMNKRETRTFLNTCALAERS